MSLQTPLAWHSFSPIKGNIKRHRSVASRPNNGPSQKCSLGYLKILT